MTRITSTIFSSALMLVLAMTAGCATPMKSPGYVIEKDVSRIIKLKDGTTCEEPAGLEQTRDRPAAIKLKEVFDSEEPTPEAKTRARTIGATPEEIEAVFFDVCRAYVNADIPQWELDRDKAIYADLHQHSIAQGIKQWRDKKDGIADAGKLCLVSMPDTDPDHRSFTRVVPPEATVGDCAQLAAANGSSEFLLGCTQGHWKNTWARRPIALKDKTHAVSVKGTAFAPQPDCGWN